MKNKEILLDVMGDTDERLVPELTAKKKKSGILGWTALGGVCAAAVIACVAILPKTDGEKINLPATESSSKSPSESSHSVNISNKAAALLAYILKCRSTLMKPN